MIAAEWRLFNLQNSMFIDRLCYVYVMDMNTL